MRKPYFMLLQDYYLHNYKRKRSLADLSTYYFIKDG